jgi:hypothetical protein
VFGLPLLRTASATRCRDIPRPQQIHFRFAFGDKDRLAIADGFDQIGKSIRYDRRTFDAVNPIAISAGLLLSERLFLAVPMRTPTAAPPLLWIGSNSMDDEACPVRLLGEGRDHNVTHTGVIVLAVGLRRIAGERGARGHEVATVDQLDEFNHVAALVAATAVEDLFFQMDSEPISAAALRACSDKFGAAAF